MIQRSSWRLIICGLLTAAMLVFIWGNSLMVAESSGQISGWFGQLIGKFLPIFSPDKPNGSLLLRKCTHLCEFFLLGGLLCWGCAMLQSRRLTVFFAALGCGIAAAAIDETIQRFVPGRSGCIQDVVLDSAGVLTGVLTAYLVILLTLRCRKEEA